MVRRLVSCFVALAVLASAGFGADIRALVPGPGESVAVLQAPANGQWRIVASADLSEVKPCLADGAVVVLKAPPGRYLVRWRQSPLRSWQALDLDLGGVVPPGPSPKPDDVPVPVPTSVTIAVVVHEGSDPADDVDIAGIRKSGIDGDIAAWSRAVGAKFLVVDQNVTDETKKAPKDLVPFLREAEGKKLPWLIAVGRADAAGDAPIVLSERCPADAAAVLKALGGSK